MKKLLTLMFLISGINIFGAANGAMIKNTTDDFLTFQADYGSGLDETSAFYQWPRKEVSASKYYRIPSKGRVLIDLVSNKFGKVISYDKERDYNQVDTSKPFALFQKMIDENKIRKTAKFLSPQENDKDYLLMENKWDNETDYVIISQEDFNKPEWQSTK